MLMEYNEIGRFGSYGMAMKKAKELKERDPGANNHYIFKDITNGPFTSFKTDAYVLMEGPKVPFNDVENLETEDEDG